MERVRFGIIGCGTVASYGHLPGIAASDEAELVAASDLSDARLEEVRQKYPGVDTYPDYRELLARDDLEAVGIAVPLPEHPKVMMDAAAAGKHALSEKPIAPTAELGWQMVQAAKDAGTLLAINFERRMTDPFPEMKRLLDEGVIGKLKVIRCVGNWMGGRWAGADRYRMLITEGLGPIVDCGIHDFDFVRWVSGSEFSEMSAIGTNIEDWPNPDHVLATSRLTDGTMVLIETGWAYTHTTACHEANLRIDLIGEEGIISHVDSQTSIDGCEPRHEFSVYGRTGCWRTAVTSPKKSFDRMYTLFARSVRQGSLAEPLPSGEDGVRALEAALDALAMAKE